MYTQAASVRREVGDLEGAAGSLNNLGTIHHDRGNYAAAERFLRECLELQPDSAEATVNLGECALQLGKDAEAQQLVAEALRLFRERGDEESEIFALGSLARLALAERDMQAASSFLADARRLNDLQRNDNRARYIDLDEARLLMLSGRVSEAVALAIGALDYVHDLGIKRETADALDILAEAALRNGKPGVAGRLWGTVESLLLISGFSLGLRREAERSELIESLAHATTLSLLEEGRVQGRAFDVDSAVRLVHATFAPTAQP